MHAFGRSCRIQEEIIIKGRCAAAATTSDLERAISAGEAASRRNPALEAIIIFLYAPLVPAAATSSSTG